MEAGLEIVVIEQSTDKPDNWPSEWIVGRGVISGTGLVSVLDPKTGDERQVIPARAIVLTVGEIDPADPLSKMLGVTKYGVEMNADGKTVKVDNTGQTRAAGIFASGGVASGSTPYILEALSSYCSKTVIEKNED